MSRDKALSEGKNPQKDSVCSCGYDTESRRTSLSTTRDGGATWDETRWEFDPASGVNTAKEYADGSRVAYAYTDNGKKTRTTWARGAWKEHAYNVRNLVSGTTYSGTDTPSVAYTYADSDKLASATLSDGTAYAYAYDDALLCTNETVTIADGSFTVARTYDAFQRNEETSVMVTNVRHAAKVRLYDSENRVCGYALTNAAGRGVSVALQYAGSRLTNTVFTLPNGEIFACMLSRKVGRPDLVVRRDYRYGVNSVYWYECGFDLLGRPTNIVDSAMLVRAYGYNNRNELSFATTGTNTFAYSYDTIGNRTSAFVNSETNSYAANNLNQYTSILRASEPPREPTYDADGNLTEDGKYSYAYDAENRLVSVVPISPTNDDFSVLNTYDHRHRRILKRIRRYENGEWVSARVHSFAYDGNNIVLERIAVSNGETHTIENFWGNDLSGSEDGAGGVGGLLAVSVDGVYCFPCYDHNGNITRYIGEDGSVVAQFVYDPYGNIIEQSGSLTELLAIRFSTSYADSEIGLVSYLRRFYDPFNGRWLNRDSIEEEGGANLYAFCNNAPTARFDKLGCNIYLYTGNDSGNWLNDHIHQSVAVDIWTPKGKRAKKIGKTSFSFGYNGNWEWYAPRLSWLGFDGFVLPGYFMEGEIEEITPPVGTIVSEKKTTCAEDRAWLKKMRAKAETKDVYSVGRHNCRNFAQSEFDAAPGRKIK